jgi:hypothetical protein
VFGYVVETSGRRITIEIADDEKTGFKNEQLIEVDLEDIFGSEYAPYAVEMEARQAVYEIENELIEQHWKEFEAFCPPEYRFEAWPTPGVASPEEFHAWAKAWMRVRRAFVDQLIRSLEG